MINSKRKYRVIIVDTDSVSNEVIEINRILKDKKNGEYEFIYALQDEIDKVLDLKISRAMYFNPCRDNKRVKGIIQRIS